VSNRISHERPTAHNSFFFLRQPVYSPVPSTLRSPFLVQHCVRRDEEKDRTVQFLHRNPAHPAPFMAGARHQLSHVRDNRCVLDRPCASRLADPRRRLDRFLPACGRRREPYFIPDCAQSLVDGLFILIAFAPHHPPPGKRGVGRCSCLLYIYIYL
jgi:hypothetical protein